MDTNYQRLPDVAARAVAGTCLLIPARASARSIYTLNPAAQHLWELLAQPRSADALTQALAERYRIASAQARNDVAAFLSDMLAKGLVREARSRFPP